MHVTLRDRHFRLDGLRNEALLVCIVMQTHLFSRVRLF
jgi:hypothetical protein